MTLLNHGFDDAGTWQPKGQTSLVLPNGWRAGCLDNGNVTDFSATGATIIGQYNKYGPRSRSNMAVCLKPEILRITAVQPYLDPPRTLEGGASVTGFKLYGTLCWWLYQQVPATPGNVYRATAQAHAWARANEDPNDAHYSHGIGTGAFYKEEGDPTLNDDTSNYRFRIGIDPFGGNNPFGSAVVWGKGAHIYNVFHQVPVAEATARADTVTLFLFVDNLWGFNNSNAFWDSAELLEVVTPPPPVEPPVNYVVTVHLMPDPTKAEVAQVLDAAYPNKQTILYSADDAKRLVLPGKLGSKVIVWEPERWPGILEWLKPCVTETRRYL